VGGAIDSPNSEQLGYLRREPHGGPQPPQDRPTRWTRWLWVALLAGVLVTLAVTLVLTRPETPEIATKAVGSWREVDTPQHSRLVLDAEGGRLYHVIYARAEGDHAFLRGDTIVVLRYRNGSEITCTLSYDAESDRLTAATGRGTFILERMR
jgi:hypothetical protein